MRASVTRLREFGVNQCLGFGPRYIQFSGFICNLSKRNNQP